MLVNKVDRIYIVCHFKYSINKLLKISQIDEAIKNNILVIVLRPIFWTQKWRL